MQTIPNINEELNGKSIPYQKTISADMVAHMKMELFQCLKDFSCNNFSLKAAQRPIFWLDDMIMLSTKDGEYGLIDITF